MEENLKEKKGKNVVKLQTDVGVPKSSEKGPGQETKVETIEPYQLRKLQEFQKFMDEAKTFVGDLTLNYEIRKNEVLEQVNAKRKSVAELEKELRDTYGEIQVDIRTGVINRPEKEQEGGN